MGLVGRTWAVGAPLRRPTPMFGTAFGRLRGIPSMLPAFAGLVGSTAFMLSSTPMESPPVDRLSLVTPFPDGDATNTTTLRLHEIAAGRPCVLHLFTG